MSLQARAIRQFSSPRVCLQIVASAVCWCLRNYFDSTRRRNGASAASDSSSPGATWDEREEGNPHTQGRSAGRTKGRRCAEWGLKLRTTWRRTAEQHRRDTLGQFDTARLSLRPSLRPSSGTRCHLRTNPKNRKGVAARQRYRCISN